MTYDVAVLHGAGYTGGELIRLLNGHPDVRLCQVTSRTFAGEAVHVAHPALRGQVDLDFSSPNALELAGVDAMVVAAEHGQSMHVIPTVTAEGFSGPIVDLSADFRFSDASVYPAWFGTEHAAPALLAGAAYGLAEWNAAAISNAQIIANPGCFATGMNLALRPLAAWDVSLTASVTALTGASGSGATPKAATHFPDRDGNVRAYKVLAHQHVPEVEQVVGPNVSVHFVPASGPWSRGIWGTAHVALPAGVTTVEVDAVFEAAYREAFCIRTSPGTLPEMKPAVGTPFCDLGWTVQSGMLVVGFALDNLLKGAASQAVQNLNLALGLPDAAGLIANATAPAAPSVVC